MREKVNLYVRLPATQDTYEFRVPYDMDVSTAASLMARLLVTKETGRFVPPSFAHLMCLEGEWAGRLLDGSSMIRSLVLEGILSDGLFLALV